MTASLFDGLGVNALEHEPMARHTSFGVGGPVAYFVEPRTWEAVERLCERSYEAGLRTRVLGRGSNTLVTDGPHPWVVVSTRGLDSCRRHGTRVEVGAGLPLPRLLTLAEAWGLGGLEPLASIPGSVGGAVAMNAGGAHGDVKQTLVGAMLLAPGRMLYWADAPELGLAYRCSSLVHGFPLLLSATFELEAASPDALRATRRSITAQKRAAQPVGDRSAGCVFKNPEGEKAGRLIDRAGLNGTRVGGAEVSEKHANFIVTRDGATAGDVMQLIGLITRRVRCQFDIELELEIEVWGDEEEGGEIHARA